MTTALPPSSGDIGTGELPSLSSDYTLDTDQLEAYRRDGFLLVRGLASPTEIAAYRPVLSEVTGRHNENTLPLADRDTYGKAFIQVPNLWKKDERAARFSDSRRNDLATWFPGLKPGDPAASPLNPVVYRRGV